MLFTGFFYNSILFAQQGKVDTTFNVVDDGKNGDGFDNTVRALALQPDQKLIVGGDYLSLNGVASPYFTRLNPDGSIDESFNSGTGFNGKIYAIAILPDGKIMVGGSFTSYNGNNAGRIIRLNSDGSYDATFDSKIAATTGIIYDICPQNDGKFIIVGSFTKYNNSVVNRVARILPNGDLDKAFLTGSGSAANITGAKILSDNKIILTGNFTTFNTSAANKIVRLFSDGRVDSNFNTGVGFNGDVNAIEIQPDGKIILGGKFTEYNGILANRIIRINADGTPDNSFNSGSGFNHDGVQVIKTDRLGNIMVGGSFTDSYRSEEVNRVCFLNSDGTLKIDFDMGSGPGSASVLALETDLEGSWYIGGSFSVFDGLNQGKLAKVNAEGEHDTGYLSAGIGFDNSVFKVLPLPDKKVMVFGSFTKFNSSYNSRITRLLDNGSQDLSFNSGQSGANNLIKTAVFQGDGKVVFAGNFTRYNNTASNRIARVLPDGSLDPTFEIGSGFNNQIYAMAIRPDQSIIVAGNFTSYNGTPCARIIRLLQNGTRDTTFNIGLGADAIIEAVIIQPDGKILVGGRFNSFDGNSASRLVRLNLNGSVDFSFNTGLGFDKNVYAIALQSDQKIIVGGSFLTFNGTAQKRLVRLNANGSLDATFESGAGFNKGEVRTILIQPDDRILVGGTFSGLYKTYSALRLIRLEKSGNFDASFLSPLNNKIHTMNFTADHRLIIGGDFNSVSGMSKHRIARLKLCLDTTIWNGVSWSNGLPSGGKQIIFKSDYTNLTTANVCSCTVEEGKKVTVLNVNTLGVEFSYTGSGVLVLENSASLYQSDDDMVNTGSILLKRNSSPIRKFDYTYWSSPVESQKLIEVSPQTMSDKFFSFDYVTKYWKEENPSSTMVPGNGYIFLGPESLSETTPSIYEATFSGIPNNGKIEVVLAPSNTYNLVGNPYPSALDADAFINQNRQKIKGTLYFWTHNTPMINYKYAANDDYAVYNLLGGVGTRGALSSGVNESIPDGTIASGQAFFVASKDSGVLEFNNSMRLNGKNSAFYKPANSNKPEIKGKKEMERHRIWLNFKNSEGIFKQILIGYIHGATNSYDSDFDAESLNGNQFANFYSLVESKKLSIQGRALPFTDNDIINLGYKTTLAGNFEISLDHQDGFFETLNVYIEDRDLKTIHNLKESPYTFMTLDGTFNDRFQLRFTNEILNTSEIENTGNDILIAVKNKVVKISSRKGNITELLFYDVSGKQIYHENKIENTELEISNLPAINQVLFVKIILEDKEIISRKIIF